MGSLRQIFVENFRSQRTRSAMLDCSYIKLLNLLSICSSKTMLRCYLSEFVIILKLKTYSVLNLPQLLHFISFFMEFLIYSLVFNLF
jgi:hypothetical protein